MVFICILKKCFVRYYILIQNKQTKTFIQKKSCVFAWKEKKRLLTEIKHQLVFHFEALLFSLIL